MDNSILEILNDIQKDMKNINIKLDIIENKLEGVHNQFIDFESKSVNNHVELVTKIDTIPH